MTGVQTCALPILINLVVMAVVPAIGEEFLFRGLLQRLFTSFFKNRHASIWVTAAIFSAIHMQFYGFLPRMMIGAMLGYMLVWSGSIWVPVTAHFINNALAVIFSYINTGGDLNLNPDTLGTTAEQWPASLISIVLTIWILLTMYRMRIAEDSNDYLAVADNSEPK